MKKLLITGSKGQLGLALEQGMSNTEDYQLIKTDVKDLDITNLHQVLNYIEKHQPDYIINCAAHTAVDLCEEDEDNAYNINAMGPQNLAIGANKYNAALIHISTDYVFDGEGMKDKEGKIRPYTEFDTPNPQSVYGQTKYAGEQLVQQMTPRHFIIRTAWLYGEGNNFVRTMLKLAETKKDLKVVNDQFGSPTSTSQLAKMIKYLMDTKSEQYGIYHGTCEGYCTWYEFTKEIFRLKGYNIEVTPCRTEEFPRPAPRPKYSMLRNYKLELTTEYKFSTWQDALKDYLDEGGQI